METTSFWKYLAVIRKRLWVILLLFAVTMVTILARAWTAPPIYRSSLALQSIPLEPEQVPLYSNAGAISAADQNDLTIFQFTNVVQSSDVALRAIAATGADLTPGELLDGIQISRDPSGNKITVSVAARNPQDAEKLVVAQVEQALADFQRNRSLPAVATSKFLDTQLANADRDLAAAKDALLKFELANNMRSVDREINGEQDVIRSLNSARESANLEALRLTAMADELNRQSKDAESKADEANARVKAAEAKKGIASPDDVAAVDQWRQTAQNLTQSANSRGVDAAGQRELAVGYTGLISQHQGNLASLITLSGQYQKLADTVKEYQDTRDFLAGKLQEARLKQSQSQAVGYLQVTGEPVTPGNKVASRTLEIALLGGGLSLVAGIVLVFLLEFLEQTVRAGNSGARAKRRSE
jgi:uncharacterized protein involved in exopolysaccharide biosynthesis